MKLIKCDSCGREYRHPVNEINRGAEVRTNGSGAVLSTVKIRISTPVNDGAYAREGGWDFCLPCTISAVVKSLGGVMPEVQQ